MKSNLQYCLAAAVVWITIQPARADVIFSNFVSTTTTSAALVDHAPITQELAVAFTPSNDYVLTDAQVKVNYINGNNPDFNLWLYSDASNVPGSSLGMVGTGAATSSTPNVYTVVSVPSPAFSLSSGTQYWLDRKSVV